MVKTAVVILNWNGLNYLKMFLNLVVRNTADENTAVYVADNCSSDGSVEWVAENFKEVSTIKLDKNYGFAGGYNQALEKIDARYFVLLNSDIEVREGWLIPLIEHLDENPSVAACQPKVLSYNNQDYFEHAGAAGGFIDKYGYPFCRGRILNITEKDAGQYNREADIFWATGACMAVRSDYWKICNGFDDDFFAHMEEIDLCWRFHNEGYRVTCIPESFVYHVGGGALPYNSPFKIFLNFRNGLYLLYKNLPESKLKKILFIRMILDGVAAIMFFMKGDAKASKAVWKAHMDYYKNLKKLKYKRSVIQKRVKVQPPKNLILNKSIVFEFYIKRKKTYNSIVNKI